MSRLAIHGGPAVRRRPFPPQNTIGEEERRAVNAVLDTGVLSGFVAGPIEEHLGGPRVRGCETAFAQRLGVAHAVAVNSATTGLSTAIAAAGIAPGDEVIVSPYTMSASAACLLLHNAIPVFADIEPDTFNLDPTSVEACITDRTRGIMVVHLFGHPAPMDGILDLAERHGLAVIEDAAQSIGATWRGRETGTLGTAGVLSLNYHKIIHSGEGGIVVTDDDAVAAQARLVRNHGEVSATPLGLPLSNAIGSNFRMTEIEAAIATEQLHKLDGFLDHRRGLADHLTRRLAELPGVVPAVVMPDCTHSYYVYPIKLDRRLMRGVSRARFCAALEAEGVPNEPGYVEPLYLQDVYQQRIARGPSGCPWTCGHWNGTVSYERGICPVAERMHDEELFLLDVTRTPLTTRDIDDVVDGVEKVLADLDALREGS